MTSKKMRLIGKTFGRLTIINTQPNKRSYVTYGCLCSCGNKDLVIARRADLISGYKKSCGCLRIEAISSHGKSKRNAEYTAWQNMKRRCSDKCSKPKAYFGRGITVCKEWSESFEVFYKDMGPRPSPGHSIDRIDNNKGYSKENCRWATRLQQSYNRQNTLIHMIDGVPLKTHQLSKLSGIECWKLQKLVGSGEPVIRDVFKVSDHNGDKLIEMKLSDFLKLRPKMEKVLWFYD